MRILHVLRALVGANQHRLADRGRRFVARPSRLAGAVLASVLASLALGAGPAHADFQAVIFQNFATHNCIGISRNYAGDWICTGSNDQVWYPRPQLSFDVNYTLTVVHNQKPVTARGTATFQQYQDNANNAPCLAVSTGGTSSGLQLRVWPCALSPSQNPDEWWAAIVPNFPWFPSGAAYLINYHSGLAVGVSAGSGANGQPVLQYTVLDHSDQWWNLYGINP